MTTEGKRQNKSEINTFVDALEKAYAAVLYLKTITEENCHTELVFSKNRLSLMKGISIPRLELLALIIGVRATQYVQEELQLPIQQKIIWTDSKCVLYWLKTSKILSVFVANRFAEIKQAKGIEIRYLSSEENIADLATRACILQELLYNQRWWKGPEWLNLSKDRWPNELQYVEPDKDSWQ